MKENPIKQNGFKLIESDKNEFIIESDNTEINFNLDELSYTMGGGIYTFSNLQEIDDILDMHKINICDIESVIFPNNTIETASNIRNFLAKHSMEFYKKLFEKQTNEKVAKLIDSGDGVY